MTQDFPPNPIEKEGYILEFEDEFAQANLDRSKWVPYYLPQWSSRKRSATNFRIHDNALILKIDKDQPAWCPEFNGEVKVSSLQTGVFAGEVNSAYGQHQISADCEVREEKI